MSSELEPPRLPGATRDEPSVTSDWTPAQDVIEGVKVVEIRNVLHDAGRLTEIYRSDWFPSPLEIAQAFQITLEGGRISAWHMHAKTTDRLFVSTGRVKMVLFDARPDSPTHGLVNELGFGEHRPGLVVVPPGVWHALKNLRDAPSVVVNLVDRAYDYAEPDHWRLPAGSPEIPYEL